MPIPSVLVQPLRSALTSQGFPAGNIRDDGTVNPAGLLAGVYEEVEFRSSAWPTVRFNMRELAGAQGETTNPFLKWLRPTVVLRDRSGNENVIAPLGASQGGSILPALVASAALLGLGFVLGRSSK